MEHMVRTRWFENPNRGCSHFSHDVWSLYEYLIYYATEDFVCLLSGHVGPSPLMFTIESRMIIVLWESNPIPFKRMFFLVYILGATQNYRCPIKISDWLGTSILCIPNWRAPKRKTTPMLSLKWSMMLVRFPSWSKSLCNPVFFWRWKSWTDMDKPAGTYLPQGQAPRFPNGWLKTSCSLWWYP